MRSTRCPRRWPATWLRAGVLLAISFLMACERMPFSVPGEAEGHEADRPAGGGDDFRAPALLTDSAGDGTPDFLRLDDESDRLSFRRWFTFLAEWQCFRPSEALPTEIDDCAALIRFAYREALRMHDGGWAEEVKLDHPPPIPSVQKYRYPFTPLGANLFRIVPGPLRPGDLDSGAFAQFADAQTLRRHNTRLASRDLRFARPADLLFFEQAEQEMPFHAMIYIGTSQFEPPPGDWVVYHTGPDGDDPGEMRRRSVDELVNYPDPRWRPVAGNANFLGVFRWNILREAD